MEINDFLGIAIVGAALSLLIQWIKIKLGTTGVATKAVTLLLAVVVGGLYWALQGTVLWESILGILAAASTVYAFFINKSSE